MNLYNDGPYARQVNGDRMVSLGRLPAKVSWLYVIETDCGVKVGITNCVESRFTNMERGTGRRPEVVKVFAVPPDRVRLIERGVHWELRDSRTVGEWFHCHPFEAVDAVRRCLRHGVPLGTFTQEEAV